MEQRVIDSGKLAVPDFIKLAKYSHDQLFIDYDEEADVLYVSFEKPQNADDSIMEGNVIIHKRGGRVVGLTITNASHFKS